MTDPVPDRSDWWPFDFFHYAATGSLPEPSEVPPNTRSVVTEPDPDNEENDMTNPIPPSTLRRHPVSALLAAAAGGADVDDDEIDALKLSDGMRKNVAEAAKAARQLKREGENQRAREAATEAAQRIVPELPQRQQHPNYLTPPPVEPSDPKGLADQVSSW